MTSFSLTHTHLGYILVTLPYFAFANGTMKSIAKLVCDLALVDRIESHFKRGEERIAVYLVVISKLVSQVTL